MSNTNPNKSVYQKPIEGGYVKVYRSGVVGYQPTGESHDRYREAMKPLKDISAQNNDLLSTYFGNNKK